MVTDWLSTPFEVVSSLLELRQAWRDALDRLSALTGDFTPEGERLWLTAWHDCDRAFFRYFYAQQENEVWCG